MKELHSIVLGILILFLSSAFVLSVKTPVLAHGVSIFAWVEGDTVFTTSKFSGGKKAKGAQVLIFDREGTQLLEGTTDDKGAFSFKLPKLTDLRIVLNAGMGHRAEWTIPESEINEAGAILGSKQGLEPSQPMESIGLSKEEIKGLIEESLDRKLTPIVRMLAESQAKGPSITEIVGGIGYIFGIMGVALYFLSRGGKKHRGNHHD
jgi:nickel transport protein